MRRAGLIFQRSRTTRRRLVSHSSPGFDQHGRKPLARPEAASTYIPQMDRPTTLKEKTRIAAGAVASLVIVAWLIVLAIAFLSAR